jgi:protein-L-isoaspartate(D-aspartate) O-methyltransferase
MHKEWQDDSAEMVYAERRLAMVDQVAQMAREVTPSPGGGPALSRAVLGAIERVPRHRFVPEEERRYAYQNYPLSIGFGQTISQPYIVALMTNLLAIKQGDRVLEIGTGCGYQTAVLAEMGAEVYSIEIVESLAQQAGKTLGELGYERVHAKSGDGYHGWSEHAPFDGIIVTAGAPNVPLPLVDQLKPGGRMVIPIGDAWSGQELLLICKDENSKIHQHSVLPVRFVPLTRGAH